MLKSAIQREGRLRCPACSHENPDEANFCGECAVSLAASLACPSCGADNSSGQKFCNECATPLGKSKSPTQAPTPEPSPALPTSIASGRYEVKGFLGEGGRKRVYLAHDDRLDRDVAVAIIKTEGLDEAGLTR
ncbi:MAG: zinc ribbon domain-containing protein, partial [Chloroflexi bacterium]|nr:zinc ribbon domain-containing protein [Chloroflexota bacterium]